MSGLERAICFAAVFCIATPALSQTIQMPPTSQTLQLPSGLPMPSRRGMPDGYISVTSTINMMLPVADDGEEQQTRAIRSFYQLVSGSCSLVLETFAEQCEVSGVTSNVRLGDMPNRGSQITVSGTIQMQVKPKTLPAEAAQ